MRLKLQCTLRHNLKYGQIMKELSAFSEMPEHEAADMCIVAILSHGDDGLIFSSGMLIYCTSEITFVDCIPLGISDTFFQALQI